MTTFAEFQEFEASEKEGLIILEASRRLMGWSLSSGSVYSVSFTASPVIVSIADSGTPYTEAADVASVTAGKYYFDRANRVLYLRASDSSNPNSRFLACTFRLFFSKAGRNLPHDLASGFSVHWEGMLKGTSDFGVEMDSQNQLGSAIEGTGKIELFNDRAFWAPIFDKYYFENQRCLVYSWSPMLPVTQAKLIYRGRVQAKAYSDASVSFSLQDALNALRSPVPLPFLSAVAGGRFPDSLQLAFQRTLYGYVRGHRPANADQELDGYPLTGTFSITQGAASLTGSGTAMLAQLSPQDEILLGDDDEELAITVASVTSNTAATASENYEGPSKSGVTARIRPSHPKRYINREFVVAGHALCEPTAEVVRSINTSMFEVDDASDFRAGDAVTMLGENSTVLRKSGNVIKLSTTLAALPSPGDEIVRPAITNVRLGSRALQLDRDYTYDAATAMLTLDVLAEFNIARGSKIAGTTQFTSASRAITGSSTQYTTDLKPGAWVKSAGQDDYFEVLSIEDDTHATLRSVATYTANTSAVAKRPEYYVEGQSILSCDALGKTDDGMVTGNLLKTGPEILEDLLAAVDLQGILNTASFDDAKELTSRRLGFAIPASFGDTRVPNVRDIVNRVNRSDFATLVQNEDFELEYRHVAPDKPDTVTKFAEQDAVAFAVKSDSSQIIKTARVNYDFREVDPFSGEPFNSQASCDTQSGEFLAGSTKEAVIDTWLCDADDAQIYANRWAFLYEVATAIVQFGTKMRGARLQIGDKVLLSHEKLYERIGSTEKAKIMQVGSAKRSLEDAILEFEDLANTFSRCGVIAPNGSPDYDESSARERGLWGFICDSFGMQNNDAETFGVNLIW